MALKTGFLLKVIYVYYYYYYVTHLPRREYKY